MTEPDRDHVVRVITDDGAFRIVSMWTTSTVRGAVAAQRALTTFRPDVTKLFGDLLTATTLVRETMAPDLRVQAILAGNDQRGRLVGDAHPEGMTRGLVQLPKGTESFGALKYLQVMRSLHNGSLHQGVVDVTGGTSAGQSASVADALMEYFRVSEQIASFVAIDTVIEGDQVTAAGGYLVQILPEAASSQLSQMIDRLTSVPRLGELLRDGEGPAQVLDRVLHGVPYTRVGQGPLRFGCNCSEERVLASLATLSASDVDDLVRSGEPLDIACDYCGRNYVVAADRLRALLASN